MKVVHCWILLYVLILGFCSGQAQDGEIETTEIPQTTVASEPVTESTQNLTKFVINNPVSLDSKNATEVEYKSDVQSPTLQSSTTTTEEASSTATTSTTTQTPSSTSTTEKASPTQPFIRRQPTLTPQSDSEEVDASSETSGENAFLDPHYDDGTKAPESKEEDDVKDDKLSEITVEHVDFVQLRLKHIALSSSNNITELKKLQEKEFKLSPLYKQAWLSAWSLYNESKKDEILQGEGTNSVTATVPEEYHIALIAYTLQEPEMYADFNRKTREVCSGNDVGEYHYKSYFKLLLLAVQTLGKVEKFNASNRFSYRGVGSSFGLQIGQILSFQHFVSSSATLKIAEEFAKKTLFELQGPFHGTAMSIRFHSYFEGENEVIFSPLQVYRVDSKHEGSKFTRYNLMPYDDFKRDGEKCGFEPSDNTVESFGTRIREKLGRSLFSSNGSQIHALGLGVTLWAVLIVNGIF